METELGEQPRPHIEPAEPNPGGVDAIDGNDHEVAPVVPDLFPDANPHVTSLDAIKEPEETDQGASTDGASEPHKETQA